MQESYNNNIAPTNSANEPTTKSDAVIFKIHDITPVTDNGVVTGCDFLITLYNNLIIYKTYEVC